MIRLINLFFILFFALLLVVASYPALSPFYDQLRFGADISELVGSRNFEELSENLGFDSIMIDYPGGYEEAELSEDETAELLEILSKYNYKYTPFIGNIRETLRRKNSDICFTFYHENYGDLAPVAHKNNFYTRGVRNIIVSSSSVSAVQRGTKGPELTHECMIIYSCREPALLEEINEFIKKTE